MTALVIVIVLAAVGVIAWGFLTRQRPCAFDLELQRIEQAKQAALEDIRRRRQFAEEQMRRLGRWMS